MNELTRIVHDIAMGVEVSDGREKYLVCLMHPPPASVKR